MATRTTLGASRLPVPVPEKRLANTGALVSHYCSLIMFANTVSVNGAQPLIVGSSTGILHFRRQTHVRWVNGSWLSCVISTSDADPYRLIRTRFQVNIIG